jgi:hypothetical protein
VWRKDEEELSLPLAGQANFGFTDEEQLMLTNSCATIG